MAKGSSRQRKPAEKKSSKVRSKDNIFREEHIDDEVDAFHKQRDLVPLDADDDAADSDDEMEHSVFDLEGGVDDSENSKSEDDDDEDDSDGADEEVPLKGFAAKRYGPQPSLLEEKNSCSLAEKAKYLKQKFGGVDEEMNDEDTEEEEEGKGRRVWGRKKDLYYNAENVDHEGEGSDEELLKEEENEVVKIQKEKAKSLMMEDFGLEDDDHVDSDSDGPEQAFQDAFAGKKPVAKQKADAVLMDNDFDSYEEVKKDLSALSKEEQMEAVYSSAPELVGLLSEMDKALNQLKQVKHVLSEAAKEKKDAIKGAVNYLEVKQTLLLTYCQAIGFYLLLKSEGHSVRDHPVIARLVEIKNLLEKMEQIDLNLPSEIEEIAKLQAGATVELAQESVPMDFEPNLTDASAIPSETAEVNETSQSVKDRFSEDLASKIDSKSLQNNQVGFQSMEMLKVRANLEAKLKKKGIYSYSNLNPERTQNRASTPANRRLETLDDFDDEVQLTAKQLHNSSKPSQLVSKKEQKLKFVSGDDDLPKRDDIGERRRKFELRVLGRAGATTIGDDDNNMEDEENGVDNTMSTDVTALEDDNEATESEDEFYKKVKKQRANTLVAKAQLYSRTPTFPNKSLELAEDEKRQISYQMEKNRGLTRNRKKLLKNPRKKYKIKHQKAVIRRKGQVRDIKKPAGPYGGETSGININVSRSTRFKG